MKDRKTKQIQKDRFIKRRDDRPYRSRQQTYQKASQEVKQIDRSIFYAINDQNNYKVKSIDQLPVQKQIRLHLWMNSTLKEITEFIKAMIPSVRSKQKFTFWKLIPTKDRKGFQKEQLGWIYPSKRYQKAQEKPLYLTKFKIGDMIDVSITYK